MHRNAFFFQSIKPKQTCFIDPPELPRGIKMHIGGVSKLVSPWAGASPPKTTWTATTLSCTPFHRLNAHGLQFISPWRQQQRSLSPSVGGRGAAGTNLPLLSDVAQSSVPLEEKFWGTFRHGWRHAGPDLPCAAIWSWQHSQICCQQLRPYRKRCWICSLLLLSIVIF